MTGLLKDRPEAASVGPSIAAATPDPVAHTLRCLPSAAAGTASLPGLTLAERGPRSVMELLGEEGQWAPAPWVASISTSGRAVRADAAPARAPGCSTPGEST